MNQKMKPGVDVVLDVLNETLTAAPASEFIKSLLFQYQERGGLSKKQLEGLHAKATKTGTVGPGKLATLEAIILKKPTRYKSVVSVAPVEPVVDTAIADTINKILAKYPQHKRVLFYKTKFDNKEIFSATEKDELEKFRKILFK